MHSDLQDRGQEQQPQSGAWFSVCVCNEGEPLLLQIFNRLSGSIMQIANGGKCIVHAFVHGMSGSA
jgi:hypothetical protein